MLALFFESVVDPIRAERFAVAYVGMFHLANFLTFGRGDDYYEFVWIANFSNQWASVASHYGILCRMGSSTTPIYHISLIWYTINRRRREPTAINL